MNGQCAIQGKSYIEQILKTSSMYLIFVYSLLQCFVNVEGLSQVCHESVESNEIYCVTLYVGKY